MATTRCKDCDNEAEFSDDNLEQLGTVHSHRKHRDAKNETDVIKNNQVDDDCNYSNHNSEEDEGVKPTNDSNGLAK